MNGYRDVEHVFSLFKVATGNNIVTRINEFTEAIDKVTFSELSSFEQDPKSDEVVSYYRNIRSLNAKFFREAIPGLIYDPYDSIVDAGDVNQTWTHEKAARVVFERVDDFCALLSEHYAGIVTYQFSNHKNLEGILNGVNLMTQYQRVLLREEANSHAVSRFPKEFRDRLDPHIKKLMVAI